MSTLADAYTRRGGHNEEAEALFRRALELQRKTLGGEHPNVAGSLQNLSAFMLQTRRPEEAIPLAEEAKAIFTKAFDPNHAAVRMCWHTLSHAHELSGRLPEAIEAAAKATEIAQRSEQDEYETARTQVRLGRLRWNLGEDRAAARALMEDAAATMGKTPNREPEEQARINEWLRRHPLPG